MHVAPIKHPIDIRSRIDLNLLLLCQWAEYTALGNEQAFLQSFLLEDKNAVPDTNFLND